MGQRSLDLIVRVNEHLIKPFLKLIYKDASAAYYTYGDITLKLYINISETNDYLRICKSGKGNYDNCLEAWETIVKENSEANGDYEYMNYFNLIKSHRRLVIEQSLITAALIKLHFAVDRELVSFVNKRGYKISLVNTAEYAESLEGAIRKLKNLKARITMKENEIIEFQKVHKKEAGTFQKMIAQLTYYSKVAISETITLAMYNEMMKLVREQYKPHEA